LLFLHKQEILTGLTFLESLKRDIQHYFATRGALQEHLTGSFGNLADPRSLGLFFCIETKQELQQIRSLLTQVKQEYRRVSVWIFNYGFHPLDVITDQSIFLFDLNDFNLFGKKSERLQSIYNTQHFELLLSFVHQDDKLYLKLLSEIHADFKIGPLIDGRESLYDMTIRYKPDLFGYSGFYENIRLYLSMLNISIFDVKTDRYEVNDGDRTEAVEQPKTQKGNGPGQP
jgi:hypothetical protein